jgi:hypothetical protein
VHLVPQTALIQEQPYPLTFADMKQGMASGYGRPVKRTFEQSAPNQESLNEVSVGCGFASQHEHLSVGDHGEDVAQISRRRRLEMVPDATYCNNSTNFFCWMSCLEIPNEENIDVYSKNDEPRLYCMDTTVGSADKAAVDACGLHHNTNCVGVWNSPIEGAAYQHFFATSGNTSPSTGEESFCAGGTSMYMDGFNWKSHVCVIYLAPAWVLNTMGKFVGAAFGTIFMGIAVEFSILGRKKALPHVSDPLARLLVSTTLYGIQLTLAYLLMLVVMTYSGPLFICSVLGLMAGHFVINFKGRKQYSSNNIQGATPCCQNEVHEDSEGTAVAGGTNSVTSVITGVLALENSTSSCCKWQEDGASVEPSPCCSETTATLNQQGATKLNTTEQSLSCCSGN